MASPLSIVYKSSSLMTGLKYISSSSLLLIKKPSLQGPKRPGTPFSLFVKENFKDGTVEVYDREIVNNRMKEMSARWNGMTEFEQKPYKDLYRTQKETYNAEKEEFLSKMSPEEIEKYKKEKKKFLKRKQKVAMIKKEKQAGTYDPPPGKVSGINLYISEQLTKEPYLDRDTHTRRFSEICARWKTMSDEEKQPYIDEAVSITEKRLEEYCERNPEYRKVLNAKKGNK